LRINVDGGWRKERFKEGGRVREEAKGENGCATAFGWTAFSLLLARPRVVMARWSLESCRGSMNWPTEFEPEKRRGMDNAEREGMDKGKPRRRRRKGDGGGNRDFSA
jgi:hypothetical protein